MAVSQDQMAMLFSQYVEKFGEPPPVLYMASLSDYEYAAELESAITKGQVIVPPAPESKRETVL